MSESRNVSVFGGLLLWGFVAVKAMGTSFAAWSWWWVLAPLIPFLGLAVQHFKL